MPPSRRRRTGWKRERWNEMKERWRFWVIPNGGLVPWHCDCSWNAIGLPITSLLWMPMLFEIKIRHILHTVVFTVFWRPWLPGFVKWQLCTSSSKMRESKCAVCVGKHATGMKLYKKGNTLNTGQVFMPVGQEMVHGSTANVNYFHILTEQVHLPVYPAYSRSEVCFLPDENSRYDLFFFFFFFL